jgi:hypothetical protein
MNVAASPNAIISIDPSAGGLALSPNATALGPSFIFDEYVPVVDFEQLAKAAMDTGGWTGFGAVTLGFFIRVLVALCQREKGQPFDYRTPMMFAIFWLVVGVSYATLCASIIKFVTSIGLVAHSGDAVTEVFARRYAGFLAHQKLQDTSWVPQMLTATGWKVASLELLVHISYVLVLAAVLIIKAAQVEVLQVIVCIGPILLGLASIAPFFHVLAVSWFWALFEVSMWSVTIGVVLHGLDTFTRALPDRFSWIAEVLVSLMSVALIWGVTKYTAMLVRGESAGSLGRDMAQTAYGAARLTAGGSNAAGKVMGPFGGSAVGNLGLGLATKGMAAFGRATGGLLFQSGMQANPHFDAGGGASSESADGGGGGGGGAGKSARRKQQEKHFAVAHNRKNKKKGGA